MKNPEKLIGKKVKGFKFDGTHYGVALDYYIGKIGVISYLEKEFFKVDFEDDYYFYPADQIEAHLVEDEIPTLSDGVMMLVSDNNISFDQEKVCFKHENKYYVKVGTYFVSYDYAKPLEPTKEEQLTAILGSSEKVSEIMELFKN